MAAVKLHKLELAPGEAGSPRAVDCEHADIGTGMRLYWRANDETERHGFRFMSVDWCSADGLDDEWGDSCEVEIAFWGTALFDGIRHLRLCDEPDEGYMYYPDTETLIALMTKLRDLEDRYCAPRDQR